jgi:hypothetical protein
METPDDPIDIDLPDIAVPATAQSGRRCVRVLVCSPEDVSAEREVACAILRSMAPDFEDVFTLQVDEWRDLPMDTARQYQENIPDPADMDLVVVLFWTRLGSPFRHKDGTEFRSATVYELQRGVESATTTVLTYRKLGMPAMTDEDVRDQARYDERGADYREVRSFFESEFFRNPDGTARRSHRKFSAMEEFMGMLREHARRKLEGFRPGQGERVPEGPVPGSWKKAPYLGLTHFSREEKRVYFGREVAVDHAWNALRENSAAGCRALFVLGMSGVGKSSFIQAGLAPCVLEPGSMPGIGQWRYAVASPEHWGDDPLRGLVQALRQDDALPELLSALEAVDILGGLAEQPERLGALVETALHRLPVAEPGATGARTGLLLVLDQFEEVLARRDALAAATVAAVHALASDPQGATWIVGSLRSDYYADCAAYPALLAMTAEKGSLHLAPPSAAELRRMIEWPAQAAGMDFERVASHGATLADAVVAEAVSEPGSLPLLSYLLQELHAAAESEGTRTLGMRAYTRLGGLKGAIARRADGAYNALDHEARAAFPAVMSKLVAVSSEGSWVRARVPEDVFRSHPGAEALVRALLAARILVSDPGHDRSPHVSVAHEAVINAWEHARKAIEDNLSSIEMAQRVAEQLRQWKQTGRRDECLLQPVLRLAEGRELLANPLAVVDAETRDFIERSVAHHGRQRRRRWLARGAAAAALLALAGYATHLYVRMQTEQREAAEARARQAQLNLMHLGALTYELPKRLEKIPSARSAVEEVLNAVAPRIEDSFRQNGASDAVRLAEAKYWRVKAEWAFQEWRFPAVEKAENTALTDEDRKRIRTKRLADIKEWIASAKGDLLEIEARDEAAIERVMIARLGAMVDGWDEESEAGSVEHGFKEALAVLDAAEQSAGRHPSPVVPEARWRFERARLHADWGLVNYRNAILGLAPEPGGIFADAWTAERVAGLDAARSHLEVAQELFGDEDSLQGERPGEVREYRILCLERLGNVYSFLGDASCENESPGRSALYLQAEATYAQQEELTHARQPDSPGKSSQQSRFDEAMIHFTWGMYHARMNNPADGHRHIGQAIHLLQGLVDSEPIATSYQTSLAEAKSVQKVFLNQGMRYQKRCPDDPHEG